MKVLRRSLHKEKDRLPHSNPIHNPVRSQIHQPVISSSISSFAPPSALSQSPPLRSNSPPLTPEPLRLHRTTPSVSSASCLAAPPAFVIRAVAPYRPRRVVELSFQKGDFFHVLAHHSDADGEWFEASNPATGARGIVPKALFETLARRQQLQPPVPSSRSSSRPLSSPRASIPASALPASLRSSSIPSQLPTSGGAQKSQPLYCVLQHDFAAERPDELDAKRGEPVIIIAQSNHEWFVAKPIGRLGGPGLIPVSFVQVQDLSSGKALTPDQVSELIQSAAVPRVEEWKKATAAYKGSSIPLGRFDFVASSPPANPPCSTHSSSSTRPLASAHMTSRSVSAAQSQLLSTSFSHLEHSQLARAQQHGSWHGTGARARHSEHHPLPINDDLAPSNGFHSPVVSPPPSRSALDLADYDSSNDRNDNVEGDGYATVDELRERYGVVVHASVESFHYEQGHYWFHLRAHFTRVLPTDHDGHHSGFPDQEEHETTVLVLYRLYEDFYDFHVALIDHFQKPSAGGFLVELPELAVPTDDVNDLICAQRVEELSAYLHQLCRLEQQIRECELVYEFLGPREGDVELEGDPGTLGLDAGSWSQVEVEGDVVEYLSKMESASQGASGDHARVNSLDQSMARLSAGSSSPQARPSSKGQSRVALDQQQALSGLLQPRLPVSSLEQLSSHPSSSGLRNSIPTIPSSPSTHASASLSNGTASFMRIKIYQRQTDDLIAIRVPVGVNFAELVQRIQDRVGPKELRSIRYRDETGQGYSSGGSIPEPALNGGRLVGIDNDGDLNRWIHGGSRMVLYVD